ncbi:low molecular weight protein arginine phosphatase [Planococcus chinensis]|uniref:Low molecular weight protein arginine phosphatase n=1 Tax=Planococcus chinensis TaxID=272917 RepID=A0ABW4QE84_9BACL
MRIFFVCTGNTCRSPMAEALFSAKELEGIEVRSAGIFAGEAPLSRHAQTVLENDGIDFSHSAKQLTRQDLEWSTLVLTMTASHKEYLIQNYPEASDKIYTLIEFTHGIPADVSDPYGGPLSTYQQTYSELKTLIDKLVDKIAE